ncbi:MAG: tetratricopeptide repeat protein [Gemmatimonadota bacterium]
MPPDQPEDRSRPRDDHSGERLVSLRLILMLGLPAFTILTAGDLFLFVQHRIGTVVLVLLIGLNLGIVYGLIRLIESGTDSVGAGFAKTVLGAGNLAPEPGFSAEESLIIRGRLEDAEAALRQRWADNPGQYQAGLRLGALLVQMGKADEAESVYVALRRGTLPPAAAMTVANRLIDLYEKGGRNDRLKVELGRFSGQYKGTGAAEHAARRLKEIKEAESKDQEELDD